MNRAEMMKSIGPYKQCTKSPYSCVPLKSLNAVCRFGMLREVLQALVVDPCEADDIGSEDWSEVEDLPWQYDDFRSRGSMALDAALTTVGEWVSMQEIASHASGEIADWNPKLAAWCCFPIVRELEFRNDVLSYWVSENARGAALEMSRLTELLFLGQCEKKDLRTAIKRARRYSDSYVAMVAKIALSNLAMSKNITQREATAVKVMWSSIAGEMALLPGDDRWGIANETFRDTIAQRCMLFPR